MPGHQVLDIFFCALKERQKTQSNQIAVLVCQASLSTPLDDPVPLRISGSVTYPLRETRVQPNASNECSLLWYVHRSCFKTWYFLTQTLNVYTYTKLSLFLLLLL